MIARFEKRFLMRINFLAFLTPDLPIGELSVGSSLLPQLFHSLSRHFRISAKTVT